MQAILLKTITTMPGFEIFGELEKQHVNEVLETGILMRYGFDGLRNNVWKAKTFEQQFAKKMQVNHCQLVSSGTSALTVALAVAGIGAGDEVIMPTFTFVASFESILALGAIPVLVDVDETLTLHPEAVENAITSKTKCVMPVHMCGSMANIDALKHICKKHNLVLLEDACQALGATYNNIPVGAHGDLGVFSFDFVKTITCGEGGAVVTNNLDLAKKADHYQDHGHDHIGNDRGAERHPFLGYNFRISELHAAVGLAQLQRLDEILSIQKRNYLILRKAIQQIDGVTFRSVPEGGEENYSFLNWFLPTQALAEKAAQALAKEGLDGNFYWYKNNWHYINGWEHLKNATAVSPLSKEISLALHKNKTKDFSKSDAVIGRTVSSLIKLSWTEEEVQKRAGKMVGVLENVLN